MNIFTVIFGLGLLLTACSSKSTNTPLKCQNIKNEIDNLTKEKYRDLTAKVLHTVTNGYPYGEEKKYLNQKIKVLELELSDCDREKEI